MGLVQRHRDTLYLTLWLRKSRLAIIQRLINLLPSLLAQILIVGLF